MGLFQSSIHVANASSKTIRARVAQEETRVKEIETSLGLNGRPPISLEASVKATLDYSLDVTGFARIAPQEALEFALTSWKKTMYVSVTTADDPIPLVICFNFTPPRNRSVVVTNNGTIKLSQKHPPICIPLQPAEPSGSFMRKRGPGESFNPAEAVRGLNRKNSKKKKKGKASKVDELKTNEHAVPFAVRNRIILMTSSEQSSVTSSPAIIVRERLEEKRNLRSISEDEDDGKKVEGLEVKAADESFDMVDVNNNDDADESTNNGNDVQVDSVEGSATVSDGKTLEIKTADDVTSDSNLSNLNTAGKCSQSDGHVGMREKDKRVTADAVEKEVHDNEPAEQNDDDGDDDDDDDGDDDDDDDDDDEDDKEDDEEMGVINCWVTEEGLCYASDMARRVYNQSDVDRAAAEMRERRAVEEKLPTTSHQLIHNPSILERPVPSSDGINNNNDQSDSTLISQFKGDVIDAPFQNSSTSGEEESSDAAGNGFNDELTSDMKKYLELERFYTIRPNHRSPSYVKVRPTQESIYFKQGGAFQKAQTLRLRWNPEEERYLIEGIMMASSYSNDINLTTLPEGSVKRPGESTVDPGATNAESLTTQEDSAEKIFCETSTDSIKPALAAAAESEINTREELNPRRVTDSATSLPQHTAPTTSGPRKSTAFTSANFSNPSKSQIPVQPGSEEMSTKVSHTSRPVNTRRSELEENAGRDNRKVGGKVSNSTDVRITEEVAASFGLVIKQLNPK